MQNKDGHGMCAPKNIYSGLDYIVDSGLIKNAELDHWRDLMSSSTALGSEMLKAMMRGSYMNPHDLKIGTSVLSETYGIFIDISKPNPKFCRWVFFEKKVFPNTVKVEDYVVSTNPKKALLAGPAVATIRLTWEFQTFTGSLFNPRETQTFCRQSKDGDSNDYCDPAKKLRHWDQEQHDQQKPDASEDSWYNHFVALHGWGVKTTPTGEAIRYWIVENSWGRIYENDNSPDVVNNGAGKDYVSSSKVISQVGKNHFVLVADRVAGKGGLEMTNREVFYAITPRETESDLVPK